MNNIPRIDRRKNGWRMPMRIPVNVRGTAEDGSSLDEQTYTRVVGLRGAVIRTSRTLQMGTELMVTNQCSHQTAQFHVVWIQTCQDASAMEIGIESLQPVADFWGKGGRGGVIGGSVADVLERDLQSMIEEWLVRVEKEPDLMRISLNRDERTAHLPHFLHDVIDRLRLAEGTKAPISEGAATHGDLRRKQGYTVPMMVEESRLLQVCIFTALHKDIKNLEFSALLPDVVTIADEVDVQLREQVQRLVVAEAISTKPK